MRGCAPPTPSSLPTSGSQKHPRWSFIHRCQLGSIRFVEAFPIELHASLATYSITFSLWKHFRSSLMHRCQPGNIRFVGHLRWSFFAKASLQDRHPGHSKAHVFAKKNRAHEVSGTFFSALQLPSAHKAWVFASSTHQHALLPSRFHGALERACYHVYVFRPQSTYTTSIFRTLRLGSLPLLKPQQRRQSWPRGRDDARCKACASWRAPRGQMLRDFGTH